MDPSTSSCCEWLEILTTATPHPVQLAYASSKLTDYLSTEHIGPLTKLLCSHPCRDVRHLCAIVLRTHQLTFLPDSPDDNTACQFVHRLLHRLMVEPDSKVRATILEIVQQVRPLHPKIDALVLGFLPVLLKSRDHHVQKHAFQLERTTEHLSSGMVHRDLTVRHAALSVFAETTAYSDIDITPLVNSALTYSKIVPIEHLTFSNTHALVFQALTNFLSVPEFRPHFADVFRLAGDLFARRPVSLEVAKPAVEFLVHACTAEPELVTVLYLYPHAVHAACNVISVPSDISFMARANEADHVTLAKRLLHALLTNPDLSRDSFVAACKGFVSRIKNPTKQALRPCFDVITALADACCRFMPSTGKEAIAMVLILYCKDFFEDDTRMASLYALKVVCDTLDTDEMPDNITAQIARTCLEAVVIGLRHHSDNVKRAACKALELVLRQFEHGELRRQIEQVVHDLAAFEGSVAVDALLAISTIVRNASEALVQTPRFQASLRRTVETVVTNSGEDDMMTAATFEAAASLVSVCKNVDVVNFLAAHAVHGLESEDPTVKQGVFGFFRNLVDAVGGASLMYAETVLRCAVDSVERMDTFIVTKDEEGNEKVVNAGDGLSVHVGNGTVGVRNPCLDEKMLAITCMGAFGSVAGTDEWMNGLSSLPDSGTAVLWLLRRCSELADTMMNHLHGEIRSVAFQACCRLASGNIRARTKKPEYGFCPKGHETRVLTVMNETLTGEQDLFVARDFLHWCSMFFPEFPSDTVLMQRDRRMQTMEMLKKLEAKMSSNQVSGRAPTR